MQSKAKTVKEYLVGLLPERRQAIEAVRKVILKNLPKGFEEVMQYGMISYVVPLSLYPKGYAFDGKTPLPYVSLASQKNYMSLYILATYGNKKLDTWFKAEYKKSGKKLDMGKGCLRFKRVEDLALNVVGKLVAATPVKDWIQIYEKARTKK